MNNICHRRLPQRAGALLWGSLRNASRCAGHPRRVEERKPTCQKNKGTSGEQCGVISLFGIRIQMAGFSAGQLRVKQHAHPY